MSAVVMNPAMAVAMGPNAAPGGHDAVAAAAHRLALSRSRLHQAADPGNSEKPGEAPGLASGAIQQWWSNHPLRLVSDVTLTAAKTLVQPVAQRHPVALVAGAAAVGALLVWGKPWRWLVTPALVAGLLPKLISHAMTSGLASGIASGPTTGTVGGKSSGSPPARNGRD